jgi:hypothetical protein
MKAKGIIVIPGKYAKKHIKEVNIAGDVSKVHIATSSDQIKPEDLPQKCKDFEVKNGKVQKKVKETKGKK